MDFKLGKFVLSIDALPLSESSARILIRVLLAIFALALIVLLTTGLLKVHLLGNRILPGVSVQGVSVGELTVEEAVAVLARELPVSEPLLDVQVAGQTWAMSWADVGRHYDVRATAEAAYDVGRNADGKAPLLARLRRHDVDVAPVLVPANSEQVAAYLMQIALEVQVAPVNARFSLAGGEVTATPGQPGQRLDIEASVLRVLQALVEGAPAVELTLVSVEPKIVEPEPARTQAQVWLAEPFVLFVEDISPDENADDENADVELPDETQTEFTAPLERVSTWLQPRVEEQGIALYVDEALVAGWLEEEIAPQLGEVHPLEVEPTLQNVLAALSEGQHRAEATVRPPTTVYTVELGDTLSGIALRFNTTVEEVKTFNGLSSDNIYVGQALFVRYDGLTPVESTEPAIAEIPELPVGDPATIEAPDVASSESVAWQEDLTILIEAITQMPEIQEGAFSIVYDESFNQAVASLEARIPVLFDHQIVVGIMQILTLLGDAHTDVVVSQWDAYANYAYPIQLKWLSDGVFVTAAQPGYEGLLGLELVYIGSVSIEQVVGAMTRIIPHENVYRVHAVSTEYMVSPVILHALGLSSELMGASFGFQDASGYSFAQYLGAGSSVDMQGSWIAAVPAHTAPLYLQKSDAIYYWYTYLESSQALYFQYNRCDEQPGTSYTDPLNGMAEVIQTQPVERLIIDLRRNPGGTSAVLDALFEFLAEYPQFSQQNKLFVLTGNQTFSSAVYLTSLLRQRSNATLIGEPTAQGPNFYASPRRLVLPNSGLAINYSGAYWQTADVSAATIEPDIWVSISSAEYFAGYDPVLSTALSRP